MSEEKSLQDQISTARLTWERKLVSESTGSSNKIFNYIRSLSKHASLPNPIFLGVKVATSSQAKADLFNIFFHSVLTKPSEPISSSSVQGVNEVLCLLTINSSDVYNVMTQLDPNKAMGIDGISPKVLKHCAIALCEPIAYLCQLSIDQGYLPGEWKLHLITTIFKSGDRSQICNYRPISLLCIISKVLEKLVFNHVIDYLSKWVLNPTQFGFLKGKSTIQQLLSFMEDIITETTNKHQVDVVYLDFRKAFDSVSHGELLCKLRLCGISGKLWSWFKDYLTNRQHCTRVDKDLSAFLPVLSGVPQGSILGPLLFILYLNDLPDSVSTSKVLSFADDTKCYCPIRSMEDTLSFQKDLDSISQWSTLWKLNFNINKFALVQFNSAAVGCVSSYSMCGSVISSCSSHKDLGITLSSDLSWTKHHQSILAKAYRTLYMVRRNFCLSCPVSIKRQLYISLVRSQVTYGSQIWRPRLIKDIWKLEQLQRRATKYILQDYSSNYKHRLLSLSLLPLSMLYELNDIMFFVRNFKNPTESFNVQDYVSFNKSNTRSNSIKLVHKRPLTSSSKHFYFFRLVRLWNALPIIDMTLSPCTIRKKLLTFLWATFESHFDSSNICSFHFVCPCNHCTGTPKPANFDPL